jgi:hypothetical protein
MPVRLQNPSSELSAPSAISRDGAALATPLSVPNLSHGDSPLSLKRRELPSGGVQVGRGSSGYACGSGLQQGTGRAWPLRLRYGSGAPILCEAQGRAPPAVHGQGAAARACRSGAPATRRQDDGPSGSAYRSGTPAVRAAQGRALPAARGQGAAPPAGVVAAIS